MSEDLQGTCRYPPEGWYCTLDDGHAGPCPAWPERIPPYDPFPPDLRDALAVLKDVAGHCAVLAGYWIRPYDMTRDRRLWRWRERGCWRMSPRGRAAVELLHRHLAGTEADR